ncbi:TcpQ domain-containing protein [Alcaligenaceae bacterium CGII-47]|nr:TcpQ domain-containing protein [Alcaligenaceae bacterium CGII-47]
MFRVLLAVLLTGLLGACAQMPQWSWSKGFANLDFAPRAQAFSFDWELSGDPQIAPVQVFDDGRRTWLQFAVDQVPPALFRRTQHGDVLLKVSREGAYLVIDEVWPHLLVRGGHLIAHVRRATTPVAQGPDLSVLTVAAVAEEAIATPLLLSVPQIEAAPEHLEPLAVPIPRIESRLAPGISEFSVSPEDGNLRQALVRWSKIAGWTFGPEHWAVDVDIPLTGTALFGEAFKPAVRDLLAATELGDRPLQPCFYANQVLRIVAFAQRCDRSRSPGAV